MASAKLTVAVSPKGAAKVQVRDVQGASCTQLSKFMEEGLGLAIHDEKTAEFYQNPPETVRVDQSGK